MDFSKSMVVGLGERRCQELVAVSQKARESSRWCWMGSSLLLPVVKSKGSTSQCYFPLTNVLSNITTSGRGRDDLSALIQSALVFESPWMQTNPWPISWPFAFYRKRRSEPLHVEATLLTSFFLAAFTCSL